MLAVERRKIIITIIEEEKSVMVTDLSKNFGVTEETVRRDLEKLEKQGLLKRTYGGAVINESTVQELPFKIREVRNKEGKKCIGKMVAEYINDGDTILLDSSSTAIQVAEFLKNRNKLTVITNSVILLTKLAKVDGITVISTGGTLREGAMSLVGSISQNTIQNYNVDVAVVCCKGIHKEKGITDSNEQECEVKKSMIEVADKVLLVVDNTKFDKKAFVKICDLEKVDMVFTDKKLSQEWEETIYNSKGELIYCT
ncbi:DeoR/GlpR family DNA-binding transcription regulator [Clostridium grantii]|uniref:Transcriptional regulator, DeoR family n=1 Tax=Clostridium grantii DSM 8605 TaxID=1121316 RepID=A0A1M5SWM0_9CLOT|nr:DeoR/GlpR family DNA-binding transcription regulator [Clostridium grantii]SHH42876.1 transcriptional regulator, DeoR family [Clostridium grantii DSM 8605]